MNIAILGFGTVGTGVYEIIKKASRQTTNLSVKKILIRKNKKAELPEMTDSIEEILNDDDIDVVVEVIGGIEPAHQYILDALKHKKHVITANKAVIARHMDEFSSVAAENDVKFYFESSVGGGIPWIQGLERALRIDDVDSITGIFNGTSNFILDQMKKTGRSFSDVLLNAQQLGYAEADPSADIDGLDVANKLCISADIAYDIFVTPNDNLPIFGIRNISEEDIAHFTSKNLTVKLMGKSHQLGNEFDYVVEPTLCKAEAIEANVPDNYNVISLHGNTIGTLKFMGQGAGQFPTANAVIQDILDIYQEKEHLRREFHSNLKFNANLTKSDYVVRSEIDVADIFADYQPETRNDYLMVHDVPVGTMHNLMKDVLKKDELAFMASVPAEGGVL
ncbi:homoserine dehydrogenase [Lentilactobacillus curieae]|uniref:Homoserine dehydrogenase n=1 Tax=Lentilactobacillus curieae TaxID=1138822 RepID=A0A1S6QHW1_9LACO|nr:homoserine dehydrogenase [Lentilactobacillus curieae]AQW21195.1 homoserine dehydrogenase [Lentilactobacillus curieae]